MLDFAGCLLSRRSRGGILDFPENGPSRFLKIWGFALFVFFAKARPQPAAAQFVKLVYMRLFFALAGNLMECKLSN